MSPIRNVLVVLLAVLGFMQLGSAYAQQAAAPTLEYLMSYKALLEPPTPVDSSLLIVNVKPGGWVKGPRISGKFVAPGADWLRIMPSGVLRLDVRASIVTDDNQVIYLSYAGIAVHSKESAAKAERGEVVTWKDVQYFITAPTFQTSSEKYAWLNGVQAVNKGVEFKLGEDGYVIYDVYIVRP
jgi:hypothetical protein